MSFTDNQTAIEAGVPVVRSVLLASHKADIAVMREAGFVANLVGGLLECHTKGFEVLGRGVYTTKSDGTRPLEPNAFAYPQPDGSWIICRLGTLAQAEAENWYANSQGYATARVPSPTPTINVSGDEKDVIDKTVQAMSSVSGLYQRARLLVRIIRNSPVPLYILRTPDAPIIEQLPTAALREALSIAAHYERYDARSKQNVPCRVPSWLVNAVEARAEWTLPSIEAVRQAKPRSPHDGGAEGACRPIFLKEASEDSLKVIANLD